MSAQADEFKSGFITIAGRPNVGKSTLLNALVGQKISITTHKPQTTRHQILGIKTTETCQMVFVDTPGFHLGESRAINRYMNRAALSALHDVAAILFVVEAGRWKPEDEALLAKMGESGIPVIAVINKIDVIKNKQDLLPVLDTLGKRFAFRALVPVSAKTHRGLDELETEITACLPFSPPLYDSEQVTDKSLRFIASEIIREKLFLTVHDELPYSLTVEIEAFEETPTITNISAVVWVEKQNHKGMIIGKGGAGLKAIGKAARIELEKLLEQKVFLQLWVRVKADWSDDERALRTLGYRDIFDQ